MADLRRFAIAAALAAFVAGCGDDEGGGGGGAQDSAKAKEDAAKKAAAKKAKDDKKKKQKVKIEVASFIPTLERTVPLEEAATIRRRLKERDFAVDPTGTENRDPFRSYLLPQVSNEPVSPIASARPTDRCPKKKLVASNYALRDLVLMGIVVRGAQRFALFRDAKDGHLVDRGSCLGREKALVTEIGDGHVTIEILPEMVAGGAEPTPEKRSIPLYASEITVEDVDDLDETPPATTPAPAPGAENL
jgi:Tfp pilus assembly protein PilP